MSSVRVSSSSGGVTSNDNSSTDFEDVARLAVERYCNILESVREKLSRADREEIARNYDYQTVATEIQRLQQDPNMNAQSRRHLDMFQPLPRVLNNFTTYFQHAVHPHMVSLAPLWCLVYLDIKLSFVSVDSLERTTEWIIKLRRVLELFNRSLEACKVAEKNEALFAIVDVFDQLLSAFLRSVTYLRRHDSERNFSGQWESSRSEIFARINEIGEIVKHMNEIRIYLGANEKLWSKQDFLDADLPMFLKDDSLTRAENSKVSTPQDQLRNVPQEGLLVSNSLPKHEETKDKIKLKDVRLAVDDEVESHLSLPSIASIETPSLVSNTTLSSAKSDNRVQGAVEELAALLIQEETIKNLVDAGIEKAGANRFERNFARLLRTYAKDLQLEVRNYQQQQVVTFVRNSARLVSRVFTRWLQQDQGDKIEIFGSLMLQDPDRSELLESFLEGSVAEPLLDSSSVGAAEIISLGSNAKNQISDYRTVESESEDEEPNNGEPDSVSPGDGQDSHLNLQIVKDFMIKSAAFEKLRENFHNFIFPPLQTNEIRMVETEYDEQMETNSKILDSNLYEKRRTEPGTFVVGGTTSASPAHENEPDVRIIEKTSNFNVAVGGVSQDVGAPYKLNKSDSILKATEHVSPSERSDENLFKEWQALKDRIDAFKVLLMSQNRSISDRNNISSHSSSWRQNLAGLQRTLESLYRTWKKFFRPEFRPGYRRLEWTCDCGEEIYGDFENSEPKAVDTLLNMLQNTAANPESRDVPSLDSAPPSSSAEANQKNASQVRSDGNTTLVTDTEGTASPPSGRVSSSVAKTLDSSYLALCVNTGEFKKSLVEIEVSKITSDGQLFQLMKSKYREVRGFRARLSFLIKPVSIRFVHFNLFNLRGGYVGLCDMDKPWSIPPADVRDYKYAPVPLQPLPPMPAEVFLHYFQYGDADNAHRTSHWLHRLPTRVKARIVDHPQIPVWGWGIYVVEGPNRFAIFWVTIVTIFASALAAMIWSWLNGDMQGGMALGSLIIAMPTAVMAAFLFKLG